MEVPVPWASPAGRVVLSRGQMPLRKQVVSSVVSIFLVKVVTSSLNYACTQILNCLKLSSRVGLSAFKFVCYFRYIDWGRGVVLGLKLGLLLARLVIYHLSHSTSSLTLLFSLC
jgi:hypothetical protein